MHTLRGEPRLYKDNRGRYHAIFYNPDTQKRKWVSLQTRRKTTAQRRFRRLVGAYETGEYDPWRDAAQLKPVTLKEAADRFVQSKMEAGRSPSTIADYKTFLGMVQNMLPAGLMLRDLQERDCRRVIQRPASDASRRSYYRKLRAFLNHCVAEGLLRHSPLDDVEAPRRVKRPPVFLTREAFVHLLSVIEAYAEVHAGVDAEGAWVVHRAARLAVSTGLRRSALVHLRCGDIYPSRSLLYVRNREDFRTKSGHDRAVPLSPMAMDVYREVRGGQRPPGERLLLGATGGPVYGHWLSRRFKHFVREAKLSDDICFHTLRHTFCSWLAMEGIDPHRIKEWAGHAALSTTERYMHLAPERSAALEAVFARVRQPAATDS